MTDLVLPRPRLSDTLREAKAPIVVVQAPTGYGKTTLVRDWLASCGATASPVIWVPLTAEPASATAFWTYVIESAERLGAIGATCRQEVIEDLESHDDRVAALVRLLRKDHSLVLVLDAYENLHQFTDSIDQDLLRLAQMALGFRVIVTTRAPTALADPARALRGLVALINADDLAFTIDETRDLLHLANSDEGLRGQADQIQQETRGYPLAIRAFTVTGRHPIRARTRDQSWGELVAQDLRTQLEDSQLLEFAARTSVPPYFDEALAVALAHEGDAGAMLDRLEWNGYGRWIPHAPGTPVFQYVETFRDVMRADLEQNDPRSYRSTAARCAAWLHQEGQHDEAFGMAIQGEDYHLASTVYMSVLLSSPESYTTDRLNRQMQDVSRETLNQYPLLAFARGIALLSNPATRASAGPYFVRTAEQTGVDWRGLDPNSSFFQRVAKSACLRYIGRYREAAPAAAAAYDFYRVVDMADEARLVELRPIGLRQIAYSLFQAGQFGLAAQAASEAIDSARVSWSRNYTVVYAAGLAAIEGRVKDSARFATLVDPDAWPRDHAYTFVNALGRVGAATRQLERQEYAATLAEYEGCDGFLDTAEFWPFITWTRLHAHLARGTAASELHRITNALAAQPMPPGSGDNVGTAMLRGLLAMGWLAAGNRAAAQDQLNQAADWPAQVAPAQMLALLDSGDALDALHQLPALESAGGHTVRSEIALLTFGAAAAVRAGRVPTATTLLQRAAALHHEHGVRAHLIFLTTQDLAALRVLARSAGTAAVEYLFADIRSVRLDTAPRYPALTSRERTVVQALAVHRRRVDVANALHVSPETVKSQVASIYRKWQVNSRGGVIERAIELGELTPGPK